MRVVLLNASYQGGGADRTARELARNLPRHGAEATLLVGAKNDDYPPNVRGVRTGWEKYLRAVQWLDLELDWRHVGSIRELNRIGPHNCDVIHAHSLFGGWMSLSAMKRLSERVPMVWTFHDEWPVSLSGHYDLSRVMTQEQIKQRWGESSGLYPDDPLCRKRARFIQPRLPNPSSIICPSRWLVTLATESNRYPGTPVHHVPNGMEFLKMPETLQSRAEARRALNVPQDAKVILMVSAHLASPFKGVHLAAEAFGKLKTQNAHVLLAGVTGLSHDEISKSIHLPMTHLGYVSSDAKLAQMYRAADITLMPSVAENFPYVALESMACQTPVVAFAVGGFPEIIGNDERGALARPLDTTELAAKIDRMFADHLNRNTCGERAREWVMQTCDMERWIDRHLAIYRETIARFASSRQPKEPAA